MATIKDVANEAGLSVGTVSRYLNGGKLKQHNRECIEAAIENLSYERNAIARSMKTGQTLTIGVIVPHLANMFSMRVIESIENELQDSGYCMIVSDCRANSKTELERISFFKSRHVDGFVLMPSGYRADEVKAAAGETPLILIDRILDRPIFDSVIIDNEKIAYENVCRILQQGVTKIGIIQGPALISTAGQRQRGYERALKDYGISSKYEAKCTEYSFEQGYHGMKELAKYPLQAVFASNYELSVGAVNANEDPYLKILGFDTFEIPVRHQECYTGICQPVEKIGKRAAQALLQRLSQPEKEIENFIIFE